ncbi:unnamed protein product [Amoebophrya sp. A25]|nr:unnamed protein product [Amoebophrya sp. A25]|eukprot:GSA25T00021350001.1
MQLQSRFQHKTKHICTSVSVIYSGVSVAFFVPKYQFPR